jgi:hypothetical protein
MIRIFEDIKKNPFNEELIKAIIEENSIKFYNILFNIELGIFQKT